MTGQRLTPFYTGSFSVEGRERPSLRWTAGRWYPNHSVVADGIGIEVAANESGIPASPGDLIVFDPAARTFRAIEPEGVTEAARLAGHVIGMVRTIPDRITHEYGLLGAHWE